MDFKSAEINVYNDVATFCVFKAVGQLTLECVDAMVYSPAKMNDLWKQPLFIGSVLGLEMMQCAVSGSSMLGIRKRRRANYEGYTGGSTPLKDWNGQILVNDMLIGGLIGSTLETAVGMNGTGVFANPQIQVPVVNFEVVNPLNVVQNALPHVPAVNVVEPIMTLTGFSQNISIFSPSIVFLWIIGKDLNELGVSPPSMYAKTF